MNVVLWTGGNAPSRDAVLTVSVGGYAGYIAYWEPGYCGCEDCHCLIGSGPTPEAALADYWEQWEEQT